MYKLITIGEAAVGPALILGARPILVGRAPECDVVFADISISRRHANIWIHDTEPRIQDLSSSNGTFVDGERVVGAMAVQPGQIITLGKRDALKIIRSPQTLRPAPPLLAVEDLESGLRVILGAEPVYIGSSSSCALQLPEGPKQAAAVLRPGEWEIWLGIDDDTEEIEIGTPFEVAGRQFIVQTLPPSPQVTATDISLGPDYLLEASLMGPGGPLARLQSPSGGQSVEVTAENRATLLYILARRWVEDARAGLSPCDRGWADDDDVAIGVWGRGGPLKQLKVLVCRLRKELREAGLDPWCVEKRRGAIRINVAQAHVED